MALASILDILLKYSLQKKIQVVNLKNVDKDDLKNLEIENVDKYIFPFLQKHVPYAVKLHLFCLENSMFAKFGENFLTKIYEGISNSPHAFGFVYVPNRQDNEPRAFIAATVDFKKILKQVLAKNLPGFLFYTIKASLKNPSLIEAALESFFYPRKTGCADSIPAEMLFISIEKSYRNKKISISLVDHVLHEFRQRKIKKVKVSTEEDNYPSIALLEHTGFSECNRFNFHGKRMILFSRDL